MKIAELLEGKQPPERELLGAQSHEIETFPPPVTGLQSPVWLCEIYDFNEPYLKVSNKTNDIALRDNFIITMSRTPKLVTPNAKSPQIELAPIFHWIKLNYKVLRKFWVSHLKGYGHTLALYDRIKSIKDIKRPSSTLNEMANLFLPQTGVEQVLWIGKAEQHPSFRIKVSNVRGKFAENDCFVVSISKNPEHLAAKDFDENAGFNIKELRKELKSIKISKKKPENET